MLRPIRQTLLLYAFAVVVTTAVCMFFFKSVQNNYERGVSERYHSELDSLKYQLKVVTEYKNRIDKLLTETQQKCDAEKEGFKEIIDSCQAMKQQTAICQSQFEDLQVECIKVKEELDKYRKQMEKLKPVR